MTTQQIKNIIVKYLTNEANSGDLDYLSNWILDSNNEKLFESYVKIHYELNLAMNEPDIDTIKNNLIKKIKRGKSPFYKYKAQSLLKYAALFIVLISMVYLYENSINSTDNEITPTIVNSNNIEPGMDKAVLTLEDGSQIALEKGDSVQTPNANSNGEKIIYETKKPKTKEIAYNYLTIPRGGQFHVVLADGTEVWLNSESQLKYPTSFIDRETRQVELVYGEAYFDVSPSIYHNGSKFIVINQYQEVEVLGTEFNIKAYKDETNIFTTLVEGIVAVNFKNRIQKLVPNEQSNFNLNTKNIVITEVDIYNEISWKDGVFSFERKTLKEMTKVLSRWYDVEIVIKNKSIENEEFVGILRKNKKLEDILTNIKNFGIIKNFQIMDNKKIVIE